MPSLCNAGMDPRAFMHVKQALCQLSHKTVYLIKKFRRAGEVAQRLRVLTTLLKVLSSNPRNHMVAHNHS